MLYLTYPSDTSEQKPFIPQEIYTKGILEETIIDFTWMERGLFKEGWFPLREINFDHPNMKASIEACHSEQAQCLVRRGYRYPYSS